MFNWNPYQGFSYPNFEIWRSVDGIDYNLLASVANSTYSYIDNNPNSNSYYQIRVVTPAPCTSTRASYGSVSSNIVDKNGNSISGLKKASAVIFAITPNPASSTLSITRNSSDHQQAILYNTSGQILMEKILTNEKNTLDVSRLAKGIYIVEIEGHKEKLVIE